MRHRRPRHPYDNHDELEDDLEGRYPAGQRRPAGRPPVRVGKPAVAPVRLARQPAPEAGVWKVGEFALQCGPSGRGQPFVVIEIRVAFYYQKFVL